VSFEGPPPNFGGRSTRTTSAPRSPRIIAACGPGPIPANSITLSPASGPAMPTSSLWGIWFASSQPQAKGPTRPLIAAAVTASDSGIDAVAPAQGLLAKLTDRVVSGRRIRRRGRQDVRQLAGRPGGGAGQHQTRPSTPLPGGRSSISGPALESLQRSDPIEPCAAIVRSDPPAAVRRRPKRRPSAFIDRYPYGV
jgi:hypothetical protein